MPPEATLNGAPAVASRRAYLRRALPEAYHAPEDNFGLRFVGALEEVLDPIVAMLDLMPAHLDVDLAPPEIIEMAAAWLGTPADDVALPPTVRRALVRHARELSKERGTVAGLERLLTLAFPWLGLRVRDSGGATWGTDPEERPAAPPPEVVVECASRVSPVVEALVAQIAAGVVPAHAALSVVGVRS